MVDNPDMVELIILNTGLFAVEKKIFVITHSYMMLLTILKENTRKNREKV